LFETILKARRSRQLIVVPKQTVFKFQSLFTKTYIFVAMPT